MQVSKVFTHLTLLYVDQLNHTNKSEGRRGSKPFLQIFIEKILFIFVVFYTIHMRIMICLTI